MKAVISGYYDGPALDESTFLHKLIFWRIEQVPGAMIDTVSYGRPMK